MERKCFQYTCVNCSDVEELNFIIDHARKITYDTLRKNVEQEYISAFNEMAGISLNNDWHVSFSKSKTPEGKRVYYFNHSAIEHVFY